MPRFLPHTSTHVRLINRLQQLFGDAAIVLCGVVRFKVFTEAMMMMMMVVVVVVNVLVDANILENGAVSRMFRNFGSSLPTSLHSAKTQKKRVLYFRTLLFTVLPLHKSILASERECESDDEAKKIVTICH
jgi:hypothetical protein